MSVFCLLMGLSLNFKFKCAHKVLKALNEPVTEIRANNVSRREHGNEGPLGNDDNSPKEGSGLFQLKECHQMHTLVFGFLLINIDEKKTSQIIENLCKVLYIISSTDDTK